MLTFELSGWEAVEDPVGQIEAHMSELIEDIGEYEKLDNTQSVLCCLAIYSLYARQRYALLTKAGLS